jgi:beta-galactosidase
VWNGYDFSSQVRREGDAVDINTKGLVSYDGAVRKDAFYFYRAQWSASPTVHITGRRYAERAYGVSDIKVYSNAPRTSLRINGRLVGTLQDCPHHVCLWHDVRLDEGENRIAATGDFAQGSQSDAIAWHLAAPQAKAFRIDAGSIVAAASQGGLFGSDTFFQGGEAATADETPRFRPPVPAKIVGSADRDLLATYREGRFAYRIPALPGRYTVTLEFVEPKAGAGERVFDVMANGTAVVSGLDIAAAAGGPLQALSRSFPVTVGTAGLDLAFVPRQGQAIVSAIIVEPAR